MRSRPPYNSPSSDACLVGNVRRRADEVPRADPPPTSSSSSSRDSNKTSIRVTRPQGNLGDGSGSESDDDNNGRRTHMGEVGAVASPRRPPTTNVSSDLYGDRSAQRHVYIYPWRSSPENPGPRSRDGKQGYKWEGDEASTPRTVVPFDEQPVPSDDQVVPPDQQNQQIKPRMTLVSSSIFANMRNLAARLDQQRQNFHSEAIYGAAFFEQGVEAEVKSDRPGKWVRRAAMERIESGFLNRCRGFDNDWDRHFDQAPPNVVAHLIDVVKRMAEEQAAMVSYGGSQSETKEAFRQHIETAAADSEDNNLLTTKALVDNYTNKVLEALFLVTDSDESAQERSLRSLCDLIRNSRYGQRVSRRYIAWATEGVEREFERCCVRAKGLDDYYAQLWESGDKIEFELCHDAHGDISLVLWNRADVVATKPVSTKELYAMGWFRDLSSGKYWRFQLETALPDIISKVSMEGENLGQFGKRRWPYRV